MKILVVDDDLELSGLISYALRQAGYLVVEAADGQAALDAFERGGAGPGHPGRTTCRA